MDSSRENRRPGTSRPLARDPNRATPTTPSPRLDVFLDDFGVELPPRRRTVRYCVDWTEQRHHLAGGLGCGLLGRVTDLGWIRPARGNRAVEITAAGRDGLSDTFGIDPG